MARAQHLVVDSGGFLKNADIRSMGEKIYCVKEVISEIRDKATRQRLSFLPYEINFKQPSPESIQKVVNASKKTGDYSSLSSVDIKVLALTYQLANQYDKESIKEITETVKGNFQFGGPRDESGSLPGFYMPGKDEEQKGGDELEDKVTELVIDNGSKVDDNDDIIELVVEDAIDPISDQDEIESEEDEDDGWITPGNIQKFQEKSGEDLNTEVQVGCITTDYAMQNTLMKMGLNVFSVDGMQIKTVRSYVLRCHGCFNVTKIMTKVFCPKCGNNTLKRVPMEVKPDGTVKYYLSRNPKVLSKRGKKVSLPMPTGGKHSQNPILCEDQPIPQNRISKKARAKTNVWSDDYAIDGNPFAMNETESRAFKLGIRQGNRSGGRRGNPNAVNRKFVKRR